MERAQAICAILFYQAEPMSVRRLSEILKCSEAEVGDALLGLTEQLIGTGLCLIQNADEVTLGTAREAGALIEAMTKEELSKDLSKAAQETLAIVLYKGPITRSEIDYIRGVNSTFILRNLLVRGLVEKIENPNDQRSFLYKSTFQLLEYMGISKIDELPDYHDTLLQLGAFAAAKQVEEKATPAPTASTDTTKHGDIPPPTASEVGEEMENAESMLDLEADIAEEDGAGEGYDDDALGEHTQRDRTVE